MIVRALRVRNFRNYAVQEVLLPPGLVAFVGDNGQGKTNLLEALCVLATTKSPLVERDRELIRWNEREARLSADIELEAGRGDRRTLDFGWRVEGASVVREMRAGGVPQSILADWLGQLQVVAFFPHDLTIIAGEPEERRRFLNLELGKTRPAHFVDSARYRKALKQRNALLRHLIERRYGRISNPPGDAMGTLPEWNRQIVSYGARIMSQRAAFLDELAPLLQEVHGLLSGRDEAFTVQYVPGAAELDRLETRAPESVWTQRMAKALEDDSETDLRRGTTGSGPHRDDLVFRLGEMDLRRYGSQGQQRLAVLSLKVALARWVAQVTGEPPILLLDDALSELDATRRARLLQQASGMAQSVLTVTDRAFLQNTPATFFSIESGRIAPL